MRPAILPDLLGIGAGFAYAWSASRWLASDAADLAGLIFLVGLVVWIVVQDARSLTIADGANLGLAIVALTLRCLSMGPLWRQGLPLVLAEAAVVGAVLWTVREIWYRIKGFDGLGLGDVKLATAGALLTGASGFSAVLLIASLAGLVWFAIAGRGGVPGLDKETGRPRLPFGVLLAPAIVAVYLAGRAGLLPAGFGGEGG